MDVALTIDQRDRLSELLGKAGSIIELIRVASEDGKVVPDDAIPGACWAVCSMLEEVKSILRSTTGT